MSQQAVNVLIQRGNSLYGQPAQPLDFTNGNHEANELLNDLHRYPHAFVLACLMDRQQKAERSWLIPHYIRLRVGAFDMESLSGLSSEQMRHAMGEPAPLHRFGDIMADVFYKGVQRIANLYHGDASRIWQQRPSSEALVRRFLSFDGAGPKIATMDLAVNNLPSLWYA